MSTVKLSLSDAYDLALECLLHNGCNRENAEAVAGRMIQAEADRCYSHGLFRMPWYVSGVKSGRVNGHASPTVERLAPGVLRMDGDGGYAPLGHRVGQAPLMDCAREQGIAALAYVNMFHIAALWPETEALAEEGFCAFAFTGSYPYVAPAGGKSPLFGTNPMGFAWPRKDRPPLVFDQASAAMARGEIQIAARDGHSVPETAGIGPDGETTTDPNVVLKGAQLGFGGYKGASLAMMIELLAGPLLGEFLSIESQQDDGGLKGPPKGGELILALDPARFGAPDEYLERGESLFNAVLDQEGTRLPGDRRHASRAETRHSGIELPARLHREIQDLMA